MVMSRTLGVLLLLLCVVSHGWIIPNDINPAFNPSPGWEKRDKSSLERRSSTDCSNYLGSEDVPECRALCAPSSFSCSSSSLMKRYLEDWPEIKTSIVNKSTSLLPRAPDYNLLKRQFTEITQDQVPHYLPNQFFGVADPNFGTPTALTIPNPGGGETDQTVVVQREFGNNAFQVGSAGLHGCTIVTIVSDRAVYMGHFWEIPGWGGKDAAAFEFNQRVLNFFRGTGTAVGVGPSLNPALFTAADNPRVYIMTPGRVNQKYDFSNYRTKVPKLISAIRNAVGVTGLPIATYNYIALDYKNPADEALINNCQRGFALFQYDPDSNGRGRRGWRLFYEDLQFKSTDPPPGPGSAKGVPHP